MNKKLLLVLLIVMFVVLTACSGDGDEKVTMRYVPPGTAQCLQKFVNDNVIAIQGAMADGYERGSCPGK